MKTTNYELFSFMNCNRKLNENLIKKLIESIKFIGYIESRPVITNKELVIIDGQHRFEACKRLKLPIVYEITHVDEVSAMQMLNMNQQVWKIDEYVNSWAKQNIPCYMKVVHFENRYKFGVANSVDILSNSLFGVSKLVKEGKSFAINPNADEVASFLFNASEFIYFYKKRPFVRAVITLIAKASPENVKKVLSKISIVKEQVSVRDYLILFENIINKHSRKDSDKITLTN